MTDDLIKARKQTDSLIQSLDNFKAIQNYIKRTFWAYWSLDSQDPHTELKMHSNVIVLASDLVHEKDLDKEIIRRSKFST